MTAHELDQAKAEAFADKMVGVLNGGSLALMASIGHRTALFDTMAELPPSTSGQIAEATKLNERYVREWLGAMVTGGFVEHDPEASTYHLPPEHAAWLTRAATADNMAMQAQYIGLLGTVEDGIVDCFHNGGGVPYSAYPRFQQVMAEESSQNVAGSLVDTTLPMVPGLVDALSEGIDVLDVGCGRGHSLNLMAEAFPNSRFAGYDISEEGVAAGRAESQAMGLANTRFEVKDAATLDELGSYGLITAFDAIHDQAQPAKVLQAIAAALRLDGTFLMQDIKASSHLHKNLDNDFAPFMYTVSCMHCMTVSLALDGEGLGAMWGEEKAIEMLTAAGFSKIDVKQVSGDNFNNYYIATKG